MPKPGAKGAEEPIQTPEKPVEKLPVGTEDWIPGFLDEVRAGSVGPVGVCRSPHLRDTRAPQALANIYHSESCVTGCR
jgi:hypothetical protein